jgi:hypothetical protein
MIYKLTKVKNNLNAFYCYEETATADRSSQNGGIFGATGMDGLNGLGPAGFGSGSGAEGGRSGSGAGRGPGSQVSVQLDF